MDQREGGLQEPPSRFIQTRKFIYSCESNARFTVREASLYKSILRPLLFRKDPESSHEMILHMLARLEFLSGALEGFTTSKTSAWSSTSVR